MPKIGKRRKEALKKFDLEQVYPLGEAAKILKEISTAKFDASVDLHIRTGLDPRKADQAIRGSVNLPHGTGKVKRVLVLCPPDKEEEAKAAGADYVGLEEFIDKIKGGWTDVDVIVATPTVMAKVGQVGRILGPRGLMPNPKTGTVTNDVGSAVADVKGGKITFRLDKFGIIHCSIGRISFNADQIEGNAKELLDTLNRVKPSTAKGAYIKSITIVATMSPGVKVESKL